MPTADEQVLLQQLRAGDPSAAQQVFSIYANRLLHLARTRISQRLARRIDPEDILQSAFRTFFTRVKADEFTFENLDDLLKILVGITIRKALRQVAFHQAAKRNSAKEEDTSGEMDSGLVQLSSLEPSPEETVAFLDQLDHLLSRLRPQDRTILELRLEGYRNEEIARKLNVSDRHIRRVLEHIRVVAEAEIAPS